MVLNIRKFTHLFMKVQLLFALGFFYLLLLPAFASGQKILSDSASIPVLVLEQLEHRETKLLSPGAGISYKRRNNKKKFKSNIQEIREQSLLLADDTELPFADIEVLWGKVSSPKQMQGGIFLGLGIGATAVGGVLLSTIPGVAILGTGLAALVVGMKFITSKKRFRMQEGWQMYKGAIQFDRAPAPLR